MNYVLPIAILLFCAPAVFVPARQVQVMVWITVAALVMGLVGSSWPFLMPKDFLTDHPWVTNSPLHPGISAFWGGMLVLFAFGMTLALASRVLLINFGMLKKR